VRPCPTFGGYPDHGQAGFGYVLSWEAGRWVNWPCGCGPQCIASGPRVLHLPGPVSEITAVTLEGVVLAESGYRLEGDLLYRCCDNNARWPTQDLGRPLGETGTWSVEYLRGYAPPAGTAKYVGTLAGEFLKACDSGNCRLPRTVSTASRNGVSYRVYDPAVIYANGKTGIPEIDLWLAAVNPNHLAVAPQVI
jgi:hypothetical protein